MNLSTNIHALGAMLHWNSLPNDQGRKAVSKNYTYTHRKLRACTKMLSHVLVLLLGEQDKEENGFLVQLPIHIHKKILLVVDSLPSVLSADLLNITPQLVRKFPTEKTVLWSQNDAPKNIRANKLWMYHKQRLFLALFPASSPGSCFRTRIMKVCSSGEILFRTHSVKLLAAKPKTLVAGLQLPATLAALNAPTAARLGRVSWHPPDAVEIPTQSSTPIEEHLLKLKMV